MGALVNALAGTPLDTGIDAHDLSTLSTFWCAQLLLVQLPLLLLQPALRRRTHVETQAQFTCKHLYFFSSWRRH